MIFLWICTIFYMREAVYISKGSRILTGPRGHYNALKTSIDFFFFFFCVACIFRALLSYGYTSRARAITFVEFVGVSYVAEHTSHGDSHAMLLITFSRNMKHWGRNSIAAVRWS